MKLDVLRFLLVLAAGFGFGVYMIGRGAFWGESVDLVSTFLGVTMIVCVGGALQAWIRHTRH